MEKLKMHTPDLTQDNIARIRELFPSCVTEAKGSDGSVKLSIDFDQLKQELSGQIVEGPQERYQLNWPGKREALITANAPIAKTLRPVREESVDFDSTKNLFIEGDNLEALKLLQETYLGKIKVIYIDPPYNTGSDFVYEDDFAEDPDEFLVRTNQKDDSGNRLLANTEANGRFHSDWLSMIYPRMKLARNLLKEDGVVFISIDDNEVHNLRKVCDEVFGEQNFISTIIWEKRYSPQNAVQWFSEAHDLILVYAKVKEAWHPNLLRRSDEMNARYRNLDNDPRGDWKPTDATAQAGHGTASQFYELTTRNGQKFHPPKGRCWVYTLERMQEMISENRIWFGVDGNNFPAIKRFLTDVKQGVACQTIWKYEEVGHNQEGKKEIKVLFPEAVPFDTPKPTRLIKRVLELSTSHDGNDIVLDFFSGSASTADAVMQINADDGGNRRFIMVQLPEANDAKSDAYNAGYKNISEIGKERIRRAANKIKETHPLFTGDLGFRVFKVDTSNMADIYYIPDSIEQKKLLDAVSNIKSDRENPEDLLFQVLLDWGVDLTLPIVRRKIQGKSVHFVDENALVACFDKGITEELVKELAESKPLRVVFRDNGFESDAVKINVDQIFKQLSPGTEVKSI